MTVTGKWVILSLRKTRLWGWFFFSIWGCTGSCRCPKHPPRRGSKWPRVLPHFLPSSLRPREDNSYWRLYKARAYLPHLSQHCLYTGWISGSCPTSCHDIYKYFLNSRCSQDDGSFREYIHSYMYEKGSYTVISASMLCCYLKFTATSKWNTSLSLSLHPQMDDSIQINRRKSCL